MEKSLIYVWSLKAVNQISIQKTMRTLKKFKDISNEAIHRWSSKITDLRITGAEVNYTDSIVYILMSVPKEYEPIKVVLENQSSINLTLKFVTQRLTDAETLMCDSKNSDKNYFVKSSLDSISFTATRKKIICEFCNKK